MSAAENLNVRLISCRDCGEPLAQRWKDGTIKVLVPNPMFRPDKRAVLVCQHCGLWNTVTPTRRAA